MSARHQLPPWYVRPFFYLRWRMAISFGLLFALTLAATHVVRTFGIPFTPYLGWYDNQRAQIVKELSLIADLDKERLLLWFQERENDALVLCHNKAITAPVAMLGAHASRAIAEGRSEEAVRAVLEDQPEYRSVLERLNTTMVVHGAYKSICIADTRSGVVLVSTDAHAVGRVALPSPASYKRVVDGSREVEVSLAFQGTAEAPQICIACRVGSGSGTSRGENQPAATAVFTLDSQSFFEPLARRGSVLGNTGDIVLVDQEVRQIIPRTPRAQLATPLTSSLARLAARGREGIIECRDDRGVPVLAAYRSIKLTPDVRWGLAVKIDRAEVFANLWKRVLYSVLVGVGGLLSAGILALLLARKISQPVEDLRQTVQEIQAGNLAARSVVHASNEVGMLADAFNSMIARVENWQRELEKGVRIRTAELHAEIAHRKRTEQELAKEREVLSITLRSMGDGVISTDERGRVVCFNACAERLTGWTEREALGKCLSSVFNIVHEETNKPCESQVHHVLNTGKAAGMSNHTALRSREGTERIIASTAAPIRDDSGTVKGTVLIFRDVTEHKRTHQALLESEARFRQIYDDAPVMMHSMDADGIIRNVNKKWLSALGYTRDEVLGRNIKSFLTANSADKLPAVLDMVWKSGSFKEVRNQYVAKNRAILEVIEDSVVLRDPTMNKMSLSTLRDVTRETTLQKQLLRAQKMEAIGTLAGGIAHDFNNLLQVIGGWSEVGLLEVAEHQPGYPALCQIANAAFSAAELTQGLLMLSRKKESKLRPVRLNQLLEQTAKMLSRTIPKMIAVELSLAKELSTIYADPALVQQIVMNLALNARDAMPEGGKLVIQTSNAILDAKYCKAHIEATPGEYALLSVSDTGCGMTKETVEHIFDPFFTTKGPGRGTGLGLSIVYGIVKSHRGHVLCCSEPGQGTTFRVYLPLTSKEQEREVTANTRALIGGDETILLVDDEDAIRDLGKTLLEMFGYTVLTAADGNECLELYKKEQEKIGLVMLDFMMPSMSGKECLFRIINRNPGAKVVICSGYASEQPIEESVRKRAKAWLTKPFQAHEMLETVRRVLDED